MRYLTFETKEEAEKFIESMVYLEELRIKFGKTYPKTPKMRKGHRVGTN